MSGTSGSVANAVGMSVDGEVPVVVVGIHGHGRWHVDNIEQLAAAGSPVRLAGMCDTRPLSPDLSARYPALPWDTDLGALIDRVGARVAVLCTPIHTHAELASLAARRGCHVLLEKPPTATLASFSGLLTMLEECGVACQVGFQDLASAAVGHIQKLITDGAVGTVRGIGAAGTWVRDVSYFTRATWAGRRRLNGVAVVDGVLSNPFAHAIASALVLDGSAGDRPPRDIEVELYRTHDIESDDTSSVRFRTERGTPVVVAATLCAEHDRPPVITVHGTAGRIELRYTLGQVHLYRLSDPDGTPPSKWLLPRKDLLDNLVAHVLDPTRPLLVPVAATTGFMHVLEAIRTASDPTPIPASHYQEIDTGSTSRRVIPGIDSLVAAAAGQRALFSELASAWTTSRDMRAGSPR